MGMSRPLSFPIYFYKQKSLFIYKGGYCGNYNPVVSLGLAVGRLYIKGPSKPSTTHSVSSS